MRGSLKTCSFKNLQAAKWQWLSNDVKKNQFQMPLIWDHTTKQVDLATDQAFSNGGAIKSGPWPSIDKNDKKRKNKF